MCTQNKVDDAKNIDIKKRFEDLNIIAFDGAGTAIKDDVITALNAIEENMQSQSDEEMYNHIKKLQSAKKEHRNATRRY